MCGITGIYYKPCRVKETEKVPSAFRALEMTIGQSQRGTQGSGVAYPNSETIHVVKEAIDQSELLDKFGDELRDISTPLAIGHNRRPTGDVKMEQTHPFINEDKSIALVHNGVIRNDDVIRNTLIEAGHEFEGECDSEVALHLFEECLDDRSMMQALTRVADILSGSYAFLVMKGDRIVGLKDRTHPIKIIRYDDVYYIASSYDAFEEVVGEDETVYDYSIDSGEPFKIEDGKFYVYNTDKVDVEESTLEELVESTGRFDTTIGSMGSVYHPYQNTGWGNYGNVEDGEDGEDGDNDGNGVDGGGDTVHNFDREKDPISGEVGHPEFTCADCIYKMDNREFNGVSDTIYCELRNRMVSEQAGCIHYSKDLESQYYGDKDKDKAQEKSRKTSGVKNKKNKKNIENIENIENKENKNPNDPNNSLVPCRTCIHRLPSKEFSTEETDKPDFYFCSQTDSHVLVHSCPDYLSILPEHPEKQRNSDIQDTDDIVVDVPSDQEACLRRCKHGTMRRSYQYDKMMVYCRFYNMFVKDVSWADIPCQQFELLESLKSLDEYGD